MSAGNGDNGIESGGTVTLPAITVEWDVATHDVNVKFDSGEFRTWDFAVAVLHMAQAKAEAMVRLAQVQQMQRAAAEAAQVQALKQRMEAARDTQRGRVTTA